MADTQSEERKSFRPPFFLLWLSSRMSILLRRWTIECFDFGVDLDEDGADPGVLEEVDLERKGER